MKSLITPASSARSTRESLSHSANRRQGASLAPPSYGIPFVDQGATRESQVAPSPARDVNPPTPGVGPSGLEGRQSPSPNTVSHPSTAVIQRAPLSADGILGVLDQHDTLKGHLDTLVQGEKATNIHAETTRQQVKSAIDKYLAVGVGDDVRDNAVTLSIAIDGIAGVIAEKLYDPWIRPVIASRLMDLYGADFTKALGGDSVGKEALDPKVTGLAGVLLTNDPIGLFLHGELPKKETARRIVMMAKNATRAMHGYQEPKSGGKQLDPDEMFDLLRVRFESQMLAFTRDSVSRREDKNSAYSTKESTGAMSQRYFSELFGTHDTPASAADFAKSVKDRLDDLKRTLQTVAAWPLKQLLTPLGGPPTEVTRHESVTPAQEGALRSIERKDAAVQPTDVENDLVDYAIRSFGFDRSKAVKAVQAVREKLQKSPITISMPGHRLFETKGKKGRKNYRSGVPSAQEEFRPGTQQKRISKIKPLLGRGADSDVIEHVGEYDDPNFANERGKDYLRFRIWKDRLMTQNQGLSAAEMPKFAALNVQWGTNYATSNKALPRSDGMIKKAKQSRYDSLTPGEREDYKQEYVGDNYYGNVHLVLKDSIKTSKRVVYTATDHGAPHFDPLLAVWDAASGRMITRLKDQADGALLRTVFNEASTKPVNILTSMLLIEAQIYGRLRFSEDVAEIAYAPTIREDMKQNIRTFCKRHGIRHLEISPDDQKLTQALLATDESDEAKSYPKSAEY